MTPDFLNILREIVGTGKPGSTKTDGIWYELTQANKNGNLGIYGDILAKSAAIEDGAPTLELALKILENLNVNVVALEPGATATSELDENGTWQVGIPTGINGTNGVDGLTPVPVFSYNNTTGNIEVSTTYVASTEIPEEEW